MSRKCPVCGGIENTVIKRIQMATLPQEGYPLPPQYDIVVCSNCGFCYADTTATLSDYDTYYANYNNYSGQEDNKLFEKTFTPIREFIQENLPISANILDIGFGKGELLLRLQKLGYTSLTGLDPSQHSVDKLREHGICAYRRSIYDAPGELKDSFDLVFLTSVMEHLLEPKVAIDKVCKYVKNGGYLIIDIPDYAMVDKVDLPIPNQFNQEHINYFSEDSFVAMLYGTKCQLIYSISIELKDETNQTSEYSRMFMMRKRKATADEDASELKRDDRTEAAIKRYLLHAREKQDKTASVINELCESQTPLIIWGTGAMTMSLLASTKLSQCNIIAFTDGNPLKVGITINEKTVVAPEDLDHYPDAVIAICAMKYVEEIKTRIATLGFQNRIIEFV